MQLNIEYRTKNDTLPFFHLRNSIFLVLHLMFSSKMLYFFLTLNAYGDKEGGADYKKTA